MFAASVVVVVPSGESSRRKGRHGVICRQNCDPFLSALCVPWCKKALCKYYSFPFPFYMLILPKDIIGLLVT